ncbi:hypothetical protein ID866_1077 [Astraeus odoratus]|nr:hypothetical protein ID866_1077 [Astraeus odoratus]
MLRLSVRLDKLSMCAFPVATEAAGITKVVISKVVVVTGKVIEARRAHCCDISTLVSGVFLDNTLKTLCTVDLT